MVDSGFPTSINSKDESYVDNSCVVIEDTDDLELIDITCARKTLVIPKVQSMQEYILKHHKRLIVSELNQQLRGGTLQDLYGVVPTLTSIKLSDCSFGEMTFWRYNIHTLLVDVSITFTHRAKENVYSYDLFSEIWVDMQTGMSFTCGESGHLEDKPPRDFWMLSNYLVPILRKDEVEKGAEDLLLRFCPLALEDRTEHNAYVLANRMGLTVERYPLHEQKNTLSMLFFSSGSISIDEKDGSGYQSERTREVTIPANTILINTNAVHKDYCQLEIYHECIHFDWHYMFFRLQDMHNSDIRTLRTRRTVITSNKTPTNPLKWMEWQARRGSFGLMMPLCMMRQLVEHLFTSPYITDAHAGKKFDRIARSIARDYDLPKFRVRARLIQMGHMAAQGALNYVDGRYIEPFAFSLNNTGVNITFVIDRANVYAIYKSDENFRRHIHSGNYIYADGHVCLNDHRFIRKTTLGVRLTPWANAHVDECCLRFIHIYEQCGIAEYRFGALNSDEEYNRHYFAFAEIKSELTGKEQFAAMTQILDAMPTSFSGALTYLMKLARITIEDLEGRSHISGRTISRFRTDDNREYTIDQLIALCVAMNLPPWLSRSLLQRAGFILRTSKQHQAYQFILDCLFMDSVDDVQHFLRESGCHPLKLNVTDEGN